MGFIETTKGKEIMTTLKKIGEAKRELGIGVLYAGEGGEVVFSGITIPITWPRRLI